MKTYLGSCLVIGLLILSGAASLASPTQIQGKNLQDTAIFLHQPHRHQRRHHRHDTGLQTNHRHPGEPLLPVQRRTYEFPLGTTITSIQVTPTTTQTTTSPHPSPSHHSRRKMTSRPHQVSHPAPSTPRTNRIPPPGSPPNSPAVSTTRTNLPPSSPSNSTPSATTPCNRPSNTPHRSPSTSITSHPPTPYPGE